MIEMDNLYDFVLSMDACIKHNRRETENILTISKKGDTPQVCEMPTARFTPEGFEFKMCNNLIAYCDNYKRMEAVVIYYAVRAFLELPDNKCIFYLEELCNRYGKKRLLGKDVTHRFREAFIKGKEIAKEYYQLIN